MNKVHKVILKNFKFFLGENELDVDSKNLIIYGENGSGKSSIYWAIYTFLHSVFKPDDIDIKKYFDPANDQNLINRFAPAGEESAIIIDFIDETKTITRKEISYTVINTKAGDLVKEAASASDFINYRILSRLYDFSNSLQIDLFPLFETEVLMFLTLTRELSPGVNNAADWWKYLKPGMQPRTNMSDAAYGAFQDKIWEFNDELRNYLLRIVETANDYLQQKFKQKLKLNFEYKPASYNAFMNGSTTTRNHKTIAPKIILSVEYLHDLLAAPKKYLGRPQSFLNEARLTSIALSIRFAVLDDKYLIDASKILILDDLLISLDMGNRDIVLEIILENFTDYQIIMLTHDRMFFELAKHKAKRLGQENWAYFEMYESEKNGIPVPFITKSDSYLEKAKTYFHRHEYEITGNFLRKQAEAFCKSFLPKRQQFTPDLSPRQLDDLIKQSVTYATACGLNPNTFRDLDGHRKFVLNPASHDIYSVAKFNHEIGKCIETFDELEALRYDHTISVGTHFEFELVGDADGATYKVDFTFDEPTVLIKQPGQDSVLSQSKIVFNMQRDGDLQIENRYEIVNLSNFYSRWYNKSDKAKSADFWNVITQVGTGASIADFRAY
jgi:energy-coupling factor transporter ATP-binding protein EcfA2